MISDIGSDMDYKDGHLVLWYSIEYYWCYYYDCKERMDCKDRTDCKDGMDYKDKTDWSIDQ